MEVLGAGLLAIGIGDVVRSLSGEAGKGWRARLAVPTGVAVGLALLILSSYPTWQVIVFVTLSFPALLIWGQLRSWTDSNQAWLSRLALLFFAVLASVLVASTALLQEPATESPLAKWLFELPFEATSDLGSGEFVLILGIAACQIATGNALVRVLMMTTGISVQGPRNILRGGRVIGPMERLLILGFVLGGEPAGAAVVVAAKSLLRFPEVSHASGENGVAELSEYFLVGSLASWLVALAPTILLA